MAYIPNTDNDRAEMLDAIGVGKVDDLFYDIPESMRYPTLDLPEPASEMKVLGELQVLSEFNVDLNHAACFLGAGAYRHFIPSVVGHMTSRSEFYTAYTPYQPEISQGTLQAIFEYQSMICALTGMDVANASHYDGGTATAEAVIMAVSVSRGKRRKIIISPRVHHEYREVIRTYTQGMSLNIVGDNDPQAKLADLEPLLDNETACVIVQYPDFLGRIYGSSALAAAAHDCGALLIVVADPVALGMLVPPGSHGADIVVGEGQGLGAGLNFGGPYLGFFATRDKYMRKMAGRLVGQTLDAEGKRGFVLTLSTREQHIRREKATSNICTNQGLIVLAAAVYMAALGRCGMRQVAELCYHRAHYAAQKIDELDGFCLEQNAPFFNEFVVSVPGDVTAVYNHLVQAGFAVEAPDALRSLGLENSLRLAVTEKRKKDELDRLIEVLGANR